MEFLKESLENISKIPKGILKVHLESIKGSRKIIQSLTCFKEHVVKKLIQKKALEYKGIDKKSYILILFLELTI